jgi:mono/diheme cytochrome c family protein
MNMFPAPIRWMLAMSILLVPSGLALADDSAPTAANSAPVTEQQKTEARAIFAQQCSWCHGSYGMTADKGPRLAGTQMTEKQVEERIRNGKPGYMPSFRKFLNDDQIALMAHYIKSLQPEE